MSPRGNGEVICSVCVRVGVSIFASESPTGSWRSERHLKEEGRKRFLAWTAEGPETEGCRIFGKNCSDWSKVRWCFACLFCLFFYLCCLKFPCLLAFLPYYDLRVLYLTADNRRNHCSLFPADFDGCDLLNPSLRSSWLQTMERLKILLMLPKQVWGTKPYWQLRTIEI